MTPPSYPRPMMWRTVECGDTIRGADGGRWRVARRETAMTRGAWWRPSAAVELVAEADPSNRRTGTPRGTDAVTVLARGPLGQAVDTFTGAGLSAHVLSYEG